MKTNANSDNQNTRSANSPIRIVLFVVVIVLAAIGFWLSRQFLNVEYLADRELALKSFYQSNPVLVILIAFLVYALVTGLSIPGATIMSLIYAWFFGFWTSLLLISFASTAGATMAFLISRYLFRDWIESKFGNRLATFNESLDREGAFYLFTLRLVPAVPFFVINAVMGLTRLKTVTFWWVSQIGMLAGTAVYCYAGSRIPNLQSISEKGIGAVFTSSQLTQLTIAFVLLGVFPLIVRKLVSRFQKTANSSAISPP